MRNFFTFSNLKLTFIFIIIFSFSQITANAGAVYDKTFGTNGSVSTNIGTSAQATSVVIQPDGKILTVGTVGTGDSQDTVLVRYNPNGSLDASFGNNGIVIQALSPVNEKANDLGLQSDGKIIVAGNIFSVATQTTDFSVARFNQNGSLDTTFGTNGIATFDQSGNDNFNAVAVQSDNKIVAVGSTFPSANQDFAAVRFTENGTLDSTFANNGVFIYEASPFDTNQSYKAVKIMADGHIVLAGSGGTTIALEFLAMLGSNGILDSNFGSGGIKFISASDTSLKMDLEVLPDGKFMVLNRFKIHKLLSNGDPDPDFTNLGLPGVTSAFGTNLAVRSDGRFIVLNQSNYTTMFNNKGGFIEPVRNLRGSDIAIQNDDKFVILSSSGSQFTVSRFNTITSPGTRIADFDYDGKTDFIVKRAGEERADVLKSSQGATAYTVNGRIIPEDFETSLNSSSFRITSWYLDQDSLGYFRRATDFGQNVSQVQWGTAGDIPVGGDYDGKIRDFVFPNKPSEYAIFRPSDGNWWVFNSSTNTYFVTKWGINGDKPVPADYDYDGITDHAVYRPSTGTWWILRSSDRSYMEVKFGIASDIPLTGDFDGDGKADFTVYRPSEGNWYQLLTTEGFRVTRFGLETDYPVPGDYDGDGRHDVAVFREGIWYILQSTDGLKIVNWGNPGDVPIAVRYDQ